MQRFILVLLVAASVFVSKLALADPAIVVGWAWSGVSPVVYYSSASAACNSQSTSAIKYAAVADGTSAGYHCQGTYVSTGSSPSSLQNSLVPQFGCVSGATPNMNYPAAQQCPANCVAGRSTSFWTTTVVPAGSTLASLPVPAYPVSDGYCAVVIDSVGDCGLYGTTEECEFNAHQTGSALTVDPNWQQPSKTAPAGPATPTNVPPVKSSSCPGGTTQAGLDPSGIPICYGSGTSPLPATTTTTTNPTVTTNNSDGSTTAVTTSSQTNTDGSTTTTTITTNTSSSGAVTVSKSTSTSTTPTGAAGTPSTPATTPSSSSGGSSNPVDPALANLCKTNPNLNVCNNSSVSGSCAQVACTGDAIQCATLRAAAQMQCQQAADVANVAAMPETALGTQIMAGNDPMNSQIQAQIKGTTVDMSNPGVNGDTSGFLNGGACLADRSIQVLGHSITISFSQLCPALGTAKQVILAIAWLVFAFIVIGASNEDSDFHLGG